MSLSAYFDVNVRFAYARELRALGFDVLLAQQDGAGRTPDPELLDRATALERVFVTGDKDFLAEAADRQRHSRMFWGIVFVPQRNVPIGRCVQDLALILDAYLPSDIVNRVEYIPLK